MFFYQKAFLIMGISIFSAKLLAQTTLDEVVITASKTEQKLSQTGKVVTVLTDSILQKYQGQTVAELLSKQAGFMIVGSNGGLGSNQEMYLRGASNGNTLVMIDGVPLYDPSYISSGFDLNMLNVCECERIEILKGAQSTLYGSDAVAGVVNIFTKKSKTNKPIDLSFATNFGSFSTFRNTGAVSGIVDKFYYNIQATTLQSKGISAASPVKNEIFEKDGFNQNSVLANMGYNYSQKLTFKLRAMANNYKNDIDAGPFTDEKDYITKQKLALIGLSLDYKTNKQKLVFNYNLAKNDRIFTNDSSFVAIGAFDKYSKQTFGGISHFAELFFANKINKNFELVIGTDLRAANLSQKYISISNYGLYEAAPIGKDTAKSNIYSIYGSVLFSLNNFYCEIGGRLNKHSFYGNNSTFSINPSYLVNNQLKVFLNISSGFKVPSLYQLFSPYGNKKLRPEKSNSTEIGSQFFTKNKKSNIRILYFDRNLKNVIFFQSLAADPYGKYINFDKQHDKGWEIEGNSSLGKLSLWANLGLVKGKITTNNGTKDTTFNNLYRRPKTQFNLGMGYQISAKFYVNSSIKYVGGRFDRFFNNETYKVETKQMAAYQLLDFYVEYKINEKLKFYSDFRNITNQHYVDAVGYLTKPINVMAGISIGF